VVGIVGVGRCHGSGGVQDRSVVRHCEDAFKSKRSSKHGTLWGTWVAAVAVFGIPAVTLLMEPAYPVRTEPRRGWRCLPRLVLRDKVLRLEALIGGSSQTRGTSTHITSHRPTLWLPSRAKTAWRSVNSDGIAAWKAVTSVGQMAAGSFMWLLDGYVHANSRVRGEVIPGFS
jgi:hypothetical protein